MGTKVLALVGTKRGAHTNNGFVWASNNEGENWTAIASHLPYVWSVNTAVIED